MEKYAYFTLLNDDSYMDGCLGLYQSFVKTKSKYPFIVLIATDPTTGQLSISDKNFKTLNDLGIKTILKPAICASDRITTYNTKLGLSTWNKCFDKFYLFLETDFDRIIYLDADILLLQNIDELFLSSPEILCAIDPAVLFNIEPFKNFTTINAGVMVLTPRIELFNILMDLLHKYENQEEPYKVPICDQFLINEYILSNTVNKQEPLFTLGSEYNLFAPYYDNYNIAFEDIKVIHYAGMKKPWMLTEEEVNLISNFFVYRYLYELSIFKIKNNIGV